ncbi:MAG: hypothetical protein SFU91_07890 [Chloroherpetonaceae bacterium]|nr:hypothetical protein [Chloroherpetonaceae bacterium]
MINLSLRFASFEKTVRVAYGRWFRQAQPPLFFLPDSGQAGVTRGA